MMPGLDTEMKLHINPVTAARQKKRIAKRKAERQNKKQTRQRK